MRGWNYCTAALCCGSVNLAMTPKVSWSMNLLFGNTTLSKCMYLCYITGFETQVLDQPLGGLVKFGNCHVEALIRIWSYFFGWSKGDSLWWQPVTRLGPFLWFIFVSCVFWITSHQSVVKFQESWGFDAVISDVSHGRTEWAERSESRRFESSNL